MLQKASNTSRKKWLEKTNYIQSQSGPTLQNNSGHQPKRISENKRSGNQYLTINMCHDAWTSAFRTVSVDLLKFGALSVAFVKFGMYFQQRLWTPLIFFAASAAGKPALHYSSKSTKPSTSEYKIYPYKKHQIIWQEYWKQALGQRTCDNIVLLMDKVITTYIKLSNPRTWCH